MALERTLVIFKPDAIERKLVSEIVYRFVAAGMRIVAMKASIFATEENLNRHFPSTKQWIIDMGKRARERVRKEKGKDPTQCFGVENDYETGKIIRQGCREYYLLGPLCAFVFEGEDAVSRVRQLIGGALPSMAKKGTIRGDLGITEDPDSIAATRNLVHASDSVDEATREISAWFTEEDFRKEKEELRKITT
ncbi:MAG: nucleoside-diphosphate kinase [bacterium]|nr:nucleoside-diphosphate kinase [bacterium]